MMIICTFCKKLSKILYFKHFIHKKNYVKGKANFRTLSFCVHVVLNNVQNQRLSSPRSIDFGLYFVLPMSSTSLKSSMVTSFMVAMSMIS